jgi:hypothetical protein
MVSKAKLKVKNLPKQGKPGRPKGCRFKVKTVDEEGLRDTFVELEANVYQFRVALDKFLEQGNKTAAAEAKRKALAIMRIGQGLQPAVQTAMEDMVPIKE